MTIKDSQIGWNIKRLWIPAQSFNGMFMESAGTLTSQGAGGAVWAALGVADSELAGIAIEADGDEIYHIMPLPWDVDWDENIWARIWFVHDSVDADAPVWKVFGKFLTKQQAVSDAAASSDDSVTFDAHTCSTTTGSLEVTNWGVFDTLKPMSTDVGIQISVECDSLGGASANEIKFIGLELAYTVSATGRAMNRRQTTRVNPDTAEQIR